MRRIVVDKRKVVVDERRVADVEEGRSR